MQHLHLTSETPQSRVPGALTRRALIFGGAAAVSGLAFFGLRRGTVAAAVPLADDQGPREVTIALIGADGKKTGTQTVPRLIRSDAEWRRTLSRDAYWVLRHADTERPFTGALLHEERRGVFHCAGCDLPLFFSRAKFDSGTGWPSFWEPIAPENVVETPDGSEMVVRTAVSCRLCDGHLGHVFDDGPPPTGQRFCMNSVSLKFVPA
jgi:peptide-methionine (R)-S-oxide reductase